MKGAFKQLILLLLCLSVLFLCVSCQEKNTIETEKVVLQCNGVDITESIYKMYLYEAASALKNEYIPEYTDEEYASLSAEERDAYFTLLNTFWTTKIDGKMPFEIARENALNNLKTYAFYTNECQKNNVAMTEEELRGFTSQMELYYADLLEEIEELFGVTKEQYISYLAKMDVFASFVDIQASGIVVTEEELKAKFNENRMDYAKVTVQTIFLKVTEEMDRTTKKELAEMLKTKIESGEDFTQLVATYSDYAKYDDGSMMITGTDTVDAILGEGYVEHVLASNENDLSVLETNLGYCVIQTVDVSMLNNASAVLKSMIQDEKYINRVTSIVENNTDYTVKMMDQQCYDAINDVPEILK